MPKKQLITAMTGIVLAGCMSTGGQAQQSAALSTAQQVRLPPGYAPTTGCDISQQEFNTWFAGGTATRNGIVLPADSADFPSNNTACDFYKWGSQMFLWLVSPLNGNFVFDGPSFFDVIDIDDPNYSYAFQANTAGVNNNSFILRTEKPISADEVGQAGGGGVLITQSGDLTYYAMHANDVYAWYRTGQAAGDFTGTLANNFPTSSADVQTIEMAVSQTFGDAQALAMELKTSWVPLSAVVDPSKHVQITATVPNYVPTSSTLWTQSGTQSMQLALVGFHVVGTVAGHPEMVWATFEHVDNAPDAAYDFQIEIPSFGPPIPVTIPVPYNSAGQWIYMQSGAANPGEPTERQHFVAGDGTANTIVAASGQTIGAANVVRLNPWGSPPQGSAEESNSTEQNSAQLVSLNRDVMTMLGALGDVRANYFQSGSVWTFDGSIPPAASGPPDQQTTSLRGSLFNANVTMETYHQFTDANPDASDSPNCFSCHGGTANQGITTSHIFSGLKPLP